MIYRYDVGKLVEDADCREVADFIGMEVNGRYCECVSGLHSETQLNHCAIYKNGVHCFSCGDTRNVIDMVKGYYENVLGQSITFTEVCRIIGDALGGHEMYRTESDGSESQARMPLTNEELSVLGFRAPARNRQFSIKRLYQSDRKMFDETILMQAQDAEKKYQALADATGKTAKEADLKVEFQKRADMAHSIFLRFGGKEEKVRPMFKL